MSMEARNFLVIGSQIFFERFTEAEGTELWISDGTAAGTSGGGSSRSAAYA